MTKFFLYFDKDDASEQDTGMGARALRDRIYYDTAREARAAIKELPASLRKVASVEEAVF